MRWYGSLRRSGEIAFVRRRGRSAGDATLVAYGAPQVPGPSRVVVSVSKAVGGAVVRNRVRRRIKGALDVHGSLGAPLRLVVIARPAAATASYAQIERDVTAVLARLERAPR